MSSNTLSHWYFRRLSHSKGRTTSSHCRACISWGCHWRQRYVCVLCMYVCLYCVSLLLCVVLWVFCVGVYCIFVNFMTVCFGSVVYAFFLPCTHVYCLCPNNLVLLSIILYTSVVIFLQFFKVIMVAFKNAFCVWYILYNCCSFCK